MNAIAESCPPVSKRSTSPRPPAVGEEVKKFHDTLQPYSKPYENWNMEYQPKAFCGDYMDRSVTPTRSESVTESSDCKDNPNPSPPTSYKWHESLLCLLDDAQGVTLFQQFLQQEGQDTRCLAFWFACRGVKKCDPDDQDSLVKLINVLFEKKVKRISAISSETKEDIKKKLSCNDVDDTIFDAAQREVEAYMMKTTYPNFLKSDLYIQHLGRQNEYSTEKECTVSPQPVDLLPTVHEDSELQIPSKNIIPLTKHNVIQRKRISSVSKLKPEGPAGYLPSPYSNYSNYHSKYGSFLPASAQDSELQSLSSDAQTDDSMSLADSNVDFSTCSRSKQKRQNKLLKHSAILNKDDLSQPAFIPRTQRLPPESLPKDGTSKEFFPLVVRKLNKILDEQKVKEKIFEKLKILEGAECPKIDVVPKSTSKSNAETIEYLLSEENAQNIIDEHVSRVFDSGQQTPAMSSGCLSPPVARPPCDVAERSRVPSRGISCEPPQDIALGASHKHSVSQYPVPNSNKHRRDHDTHSVDSAMFDHASDGNRTISYRSQHSSMVDQELVDFSQRSREHSRRYGDKKFSSMTNSYSSFEDSGISLACESVPPSYAKVTNWLEKRKDPERENHWRNSSTSPVLNRPSSDRKAAAYSSSRSGGQEIGYSQWSTAPQQLIAYDASTSAFPPPDTTSNLIGARRRLEDESRAKSKMKCPSGARNSHDPSRMKYPKGYDSFEEGLCQRKQSRRSCPSGAFDSIPVSSTSSDRTVIGYSYGRHSVPYLSKVPGRNITLRQFKSLLSKKGNFKYFFKTASDELGTGVVFEEVSDDSSVLPMWEGKVFCVIEPMDDNTSM